MMKAANNLDDHPTMADSPDEPTPGWDIMVIEDTPATQKLLRIVLESAGNRVRVAPNGLAAFPPYFERRPDIVLMDVQMPILDGLQTTEILRVCEADLPDVPIIVVTAENTDGYRERCLAAGADEFVPKPFDAEQLPRLVNELCAQAKRSGANSAVRSAPAGRANTNGRVIDLMAALQRLGGDKRLLQQLIQFYLEDFPGLMRAARAGLANGEWPRVQRAAHSLKGLAANFTAEPAVQALQAVEMSCQLQIVETTAKLMRTANGEMIRLLTALANEYSSLDSEDAA